MMLLARQSNRAIKMFDMSVWAGGYSLQLSGRRQFIK